MGVPIRPFQMYRWEKQNERYQRMYEAMITKDLFGDWVIVKNWGSKNRPNTQTTSLVCNDQDAAIDRLHAIFQLRRKREYELVPVHM